jgi:hypothetical protein
LNVLIVNLLEFVEVTVPGIGAGGLAFLAENRIGSVDLIGELPFVVVLVHHITAYDKPMLFIDYDLAVITGVIALSAVYLRTVVIGRID